MHLTSLIGRGRIGGWHGCRRIHWVHINICRMFTPLNIMFLHIQSNTWLVSSIKGVSYLLPIRICRIYGKDCIEWIGHPSIHNFPFFRCIDHACIWLSKRVILPSTTNATTRIHPTIIMPRGSHSFLPPKV